MKVGGIKPKDWFYGPSGLKRCVLQRGPVALVASAGIGDLSGFNGRSNNISVSAGPLTAWFTNNETYAGVNVSVSLGGGAAASYTSQPNTSPVGDISYGNAGNDLENLQNALMESSKDYLTGF